MRYKVVLAVFLMMFAGLAAAQDTDSGSEFSVELGESFEVEVGDEVEFGPSESFEVVDIHEDSLDRPGVDIAPENYDLPASGDVFVSENGRSFELDTGDYRFVAEEVDVNSESANMSVELDEPVSADLSEQIVLVENQSVSVDGTVFTVESVADDYDVIVSGNDDTVSISSGSSRLLRPGGFDSSADGYRVNVTGVNTAGSEAQLVFTLEGSGDGGNRWDVKNYSLGESVELSSGDGIRFEGGNKLLMEKTEQLGSIWTADVWVDEAKTDSNDAQEVNEHSSSLSEDRFTQEVFQDGVEYTIYACRINSDGAKIVVQESPADGIEDNCTDDEENGEGSWSLENYNMGESVELSSGDGIKFDGRKRLYIDSIGLNNLERAGFIFDVRHPEANDEEDGYLYENRFMTQEFLGESYNIYTCEYDSEGVTIVVQPESSEDVETVCGDKSVDVTGNGDYANDLDNDGLYEDVRGSGRFSILDVQALFNHIDEPVVKNNSEMFNFDEKGDVDILDVQALFNEYTSNES
jgi:PKD repeat protein